MCEGVCEQEVITRVSELEIVIRDLFIANSVHFRLHSARDRPNVAKEGVISALRVVKSSECEPSRRKSERENCVKDLRCCSPALAQQLRSLSGPS